MCSVGHLKKNFWAIVALFSIMETVEKNPIWVSEQCEIHMKKEAEETKIEYQ